MKTDENDAGATTAPARPPQSKPPAQQNGGQPEANGLLRLQQTAGNQAVIAAMQGAGTKDGALAAVQGLWMKDLLLMLERLPYGTRTDEAAGHAVGGPRLVTAMRAVAARGSPWDPFRAKYAADLGQLPADQTEEIGGYLRAHDIGAVRSQVQSVPADQIRSQWPSKKADFLAAACDPSNQLNARQLYQIWLHYWIDEQAVAHAEYKPLDAALRAKDIHAYIREMPKFTAGKRGIFPPEYEAAADRKAAADYYTSYLVGVHDWLQTTVDVMGQHHTLEQINQKTVELIKARELRAAILGFVLLFASVPRPRGAAPEPVGGRSSAVPEVVMPEGPAGQPARPAGGRAEATVPQLRQMLAERNEYLVWRTDDPAVAQTQEIVFTGKNTQQVTEDAPRRVTLTNLGAVADRAGPYYGPHGVIIRKSDLHIYPTKDALEFQVDRIPANKGMYFTEEALTEAAKK